MSVWFCEKLTISEFETPLITVFSTFSKASKYYENLSVVIPQNLNKSVILSTKLRLLLISLIMYSLIMREGHGWDEVDMQRLD